MNKKIFVLVLLSAGVGFFLVQNLKSNFNFGFFRATVASNPSLLFEDSEINLSEINLENLLPEETKTVSESEIEPEIEPGPETEPELTLAEIQETLDEISEQVDVLSQKVAELVVASQSVPQSSEAEELEEIVEEEPEIGQQEIGQEWVGQEENIIEKIDINTDSLETLQKIVGIGPVLAQRIIEARTFYSLNDLIKVQGIGEATLQKIKEQGLAWVSAIGAGGGSGGGGGGASPAPVIYPKILISEIQTGGQTVKDEFIELYNPNSQSVDLAGWALKKKTSGGSESNLVSSAKFLGIISSGIYFLIVPQPNDDGSPNYQGSALPDFYYSGETYSIADNNTVLLYNPNGNLVDKVGFGFAQDFESGPAENPPTGKSIGRSWNSETQEYQDTDNNQTDFEIQKPTPRTENSQPILSPAILKVSPLSLEFSVIESTTHSQDGIFVITNQGEDILRWDSIIEYASPFFDGIEWLKINPNSGSILADASSEVLLSPDISNLTRGVYNAKIIISAQGAEGSPKEVQVILNIEESTPEEEEEEEILQRVVINEVYYDPDDAHGGTNAEWIELYNASGNNVNLQGWYLRNDSTAVETVNQSYNIDSGQFVVITANASVWEGWDLIPGNALKIALGGTKLFYGLKNGGDRLILFDAQDNEIDAMSYGTDTYVFDPPCPDVDKGHSLARQIAGYDTNQASDWIELINPTPGY